MNVHRGVKNVLHSTWISEYKTCPRKFYYSHVMNIVPIKPSKSLTAGKCMHKLLEAYYLGNPDPIGEYEKFAGAEIAGLPRGYDCSDVVKEVEMMRDLGKAYIEWAEREERLKVKEVNGETGVEIEFKVPIIPSGVKSKKRISGYKGVLAGRFDMIAEDEYGHTWLVDHKTAHQFPDEGVLRLNVQMNYYLLAATMIFGIDFRGIVYNVIRKTNPNTAKKDIFRRYKLLANRQALRNIQDDLYLTYRTIMGDKLFLRGTGNCQWCQYKEICIAELEGRETGSLMGTVYQERPSEDSNENIIQEVV